MEILDKLLKNFVFGVIRGNDSYDAYQIAKYAITGGIKNIEITFSTPEAEDALSKISQEYANDETVIIGAGTVMDANTAVLAIEKGAKFIVSPHYSQKVMDVCKEKDIDYFPGCATATEIVNALDEGAKIIKIFPGGLLGPKFIKDIHGPMPNVKMMPSGGVSVDNIKDWIASGAVAVGIGSALKKRVKEEGYETVTEEARKVMKVLEEIR